MQMGWTPFHTAARFGQAAAVKSLASMGVMCILMCSNMCSNMYPICARPSVSLNVSHMWAGSCCKDTCFHGCVSLCVVSLYVSICACVLTCPYMYSLCLRICISACVHMGILACTYRMQSKDVNTLALANINNVSHMWAFIFVNTLALARTGCSLRT